MNRPSVCAQCQETFYATKLINELCPACAATWTKPPTTGAPPIPGAADVEYSTRLDAARVTLQFGVKSTKRLDAGRRSIEDSPLFGGERQSSLF